YCLSRLQCPPRPTLFPYTTLFRSEEYVVLGAHLDSWDLGQGTTDNGTGTCAVLEAARILAHCGTPPRRTIRFVLFTGEEQGLFGDRKSTRLNSSHQIISYAVFCLK